MNDPPPSPADARERLATRLRALAHPARLAVIETLMGKDACMCGDIVRTLPLAQSTVSQHIKILADAGLIRTTAGPRPCYCIDTAALVALRADIEALFDGIRPGEPIATDAAPASAASS